MSTVQPTNKNFKGFTLVELLIVIVVIAILAAVTMVAYNGLVSRAQDTSAKANLSTAHKELTLYYQENDSYPLANECPNPSAGNICLSSQQGVTLVYSPNNSTNPPSYSLVARTGTKVYSVTSSGSPTSGVGGGVPVEVENLAKNGDFSAGMSDYKNNCWSPSVCTVTNGVLSINQVGAPGTAGTVFQTITTNYTDGDKMYYAISIKKIGGADFYSRASRQTGGYDAVAPTKAQYNSQAINTTKRYSVERTFLLSQGSTTSFLIGTYVATDVYQVEADNLVVINLTKDFGAGNEPTAARMDEIVRQQVPGEFFNGKVTIYK